MKAYTTPELSTYGSVADLTRNYGAVTRKDKIQLGGNLGTGIIEGGGGSRDGCVIKEDTFVECIIP